MKNYQKKSVAQDARVELHDSLALTCLLYTSDAADE